MKEDQIVCSDDESNDWNEIFDHSDLVTVARANMDGNTTSLQRKEILNNTPAMAGKDKKEKLTMMSLNDNKAGMEGLDKERIDRIIYETSKGSKYFENERKKEHQVNERIAAQRLQLSKLTQAQLAVGLQKADELLERLEAGRDLTRTLVHIDMDAFYAAVEMRENPELRDKPMAVGGLYMLSTSNYAARRYGVRAGMPGFIAQKLCPELIIVPCDYKKYTEISHEVHEIFRQYDENFASMGLDEAYLDITEHLVLRENGSWHNGCVRNKNSDTSANKGCDSLANQDSVTGTVETRNSSRDVYQLSGKNFKNSSLDYRTTAAGDNTCNFESRTVIASNDSKDVIDLSEDAADEGSAPNCNLNVTVNQKLFCECRHTVEFSADNSSFTCDQREEPSSVHDLSKSVAGTSSSLAIEESNSVDDIFQITQKAELAESKDSSILKEQFNSNSGLITKSSRDVDILCDSGSGSSKVAADGSVRYAVENLTSNAVSSQDSHDDLFPDDCSVEADALSSNCDTAVKYGITSTIAETKELESNGPLVDMRVCAVCKKPMRPKTDDEDVERFGVGADEAVREIRYKIFKKTCLTASAGIAPNTMLAKICSDRNKPNGQYRIEPNRDVIMKFIQDLPIRKVCGFGKVTEQMLKALGIVTCGQLFGYRAQLYCLYSTISFKHFMKVTLGISSTQLDRESERKSMSIERTFGKMSKPDEMYQTCRDLANQLSSDLKDEQLVGRTVTVKMKTVTFEVLTRSHSLQHYTRDGIEIGRVGCQIIRHEVEQSLQNKGQPLELRLLGVRLSSLKESKSDRPGGQQSSILSMLQSSRGRVGSSFNGTLVGMSALGTSGTAAISLGTSATTSKTESLTKESENCQSVVDRFRQEHPLPNLDYDFRAETTNEQSRNSGDDWADEAARIECLKYLEAEEESKDVYILDDEKDFPSASSVDQENHQETADSTCRTSKYLIDVEQDVIVCKQQGEVSNGLVCSSSRAHNDLALSYGIKTLPVSKVRKSISESRISHKNTSDCSLIDLTEIPDAQGVSTKAIHPHRIAKLVAHETRNLQVMTPTLNAEHRQATASSSHGAINTRSCMEHDFLCPVCNTVPRLLLLNGTEPRTQDDHVAAYNRHIDECLSLKEVRKLVSDSHTQATVSPDKCSNSKRKGVRKTAGPQEACKSPASKKLRTGNKTATLDKFFNSS